MKDKGKGKAKVYFVDSRSTSREESTGNKLRRLMAKAAPAKVISPGDMTAIKLHFGEKGNTTYIHPTLVRQVVEYVKELKGMPFLTDTNTLYVGKRANAVDHLQTALENGFSYVTAGAPLIIADGLRGRSYRSIEVGLKHFQTVNIASEINDADSLVVLSHTKGHILFGFGGALKNLGMGCSNRTGKQHMHSTMLPAISQRKCIACGDCLGWCPENAITIVNKEEGGGEIACIDQKRCVGCAECIVTCRHKGVKIQWKTESVSLQERLVEYAYGAVAGKPGKCLYINFLMAITPDCDCNGWNDAPIVPDIGIIASSDPVAIDRASIDLINQQQGFSGTALKCSHSSGEDKILAIYPDCNYEAKLKYAEKLGMGTNNYELETVK